VELYVKRDDLSGCALSGNKVRKLEFVMADALKRGADVVLTCGKIQSNHARATALAASRLGLGCRLVLRVEDPQKPPPLSGNYLLDKVAGAEVVWVDYEQWPQREAVLEREAQALSRAGKRPYVIPFGASDALGAWGEITACRELKADLEQLPGGLNRPTTLIMASGSGGALGGYRLGSRLFDVPLRVIGINVDDYGFIIATVEKIRLQAKERFGLDVGLAPDEGFELIDGYVGEGYALSRPEELEFIAEMGRLEGLVLDPVYTAKAMLGMVKELERRPGCFGERIVFLHTGGIFHLFSPVPGLAQALGQA
jgi:D-cysteine desulfhydrase